MVNTALCKAFQIALKQLFGYNRWWNIFHPSIGMDIMKCLVSKGHYCLLSGGLYPLQNQKDCSLALYFKTDANIKSLKDISTNFILWLNQNQYLLFLVKQNPTEHRCPRNTENKIILSPLAVINLPESCLILSTDFIIPAVIFIHF